MELRTVILSFLAARYPAAYADIAIMQRVNKSGLLDTPATLDNVREELRTLSNRFELVTAELDRVSGAVYWTATDAGKIEWVRHGQQHVG